MHDVDAMLAQVVRRTNAGKHQQLRRVERPGAQDDFVRADRAAFPMMIDDKAGSLLAFKNDPLRLSVGELCRLGLLFAGPRKALALEARNPSRIVN